MFVKSKVVGEKKLQKNAFGVQIENIKHISSFHAMMNIKIAMKNPLIGFNVRNVSACRAFQHIAGASKIYLVVNIHTLFSRFISHGPWLLLRQ